LQALPARVQATTADVDFIRQHGARDAACEYLVLCFWAGATFNVDFFNFGQKLKTGRIPLGACARLFNGTRYTVIQLIEAPEHPDPVLPWACSTEIAAHYQVVRKSVNGFFLVPRTRS
jgi:hypothetical protein